MILMFLLKKKHAMKKGMILLTKLNFIDVDQYALLE